MKITEQKTKSLTFLFNKDEEYDSFVRLLSEGKCTIEARGCMMSASDQEVILSLNRNVFAGYPFAPNINVSDANGPYYKNEQGQWNPLPQGETGSPVKMPTYTL